ncbi:MAG: isocitrate lyase/phosphoenolpyruvate mutase family protein [Actinobacteria bacterium]|nr:isocitrate lyase/phosphoenolpyruvate mutase family protein [Actinomycetota bacterium]
MATATQSEACTRFLELHRPGDPLLLPNPWDIGSARLFESLGFAALATTSSGFAASLGRLDGRVDRDEALAHCAAMVTATDVPISADLEHGFADDLDGVAETFRRAVATGLAGASIEDFTGDRDRGMYPIDLAAERVAAAAEAAHAGPAHLVLTARADNGFHGIDDLADTITRLQRFQEAGADVLYAPALADIAAVRTVVAEVDLPVNVLVSPGMPSVAELAEAGVARISIGGAFAYAAYGTAVAAASELLLRGTFGFRQGSGEGRAAVLRAMES